MSSAQPSEHLLEAGSGPVVFSVDTMALNTGGPIVFISGNPNYGRLLVRIHNRSAAPIPYDPSSEVRIYMAPLLSAAEMASIQVSGGGWTCSALAEHIELKPTAPGQIPAAGFSAIELNSALAAGDAATGRFRFEYAGLGGATGGHRLQPVFRQHPPATGVQLPVQARSGARPEYAGQQGDTIYVTPAGAADIANYLVIDIANGDAAHPIPLVPGSTPYLLFSFVTGHSRNNICTDDQLKSVELSVLSSDPDIQWAPPEKDNSGPAPVWRVRPQPGNVNFLNAAGIASFRFDNLVTHLEAGWASQLYVQYSVAGYDESYGAVLLQKTPPVPYIRQYDAVSKGARVEYGDSVWFRQQVDLIWDLFAATGCRFRGYENDFPPQGTMAVRPDQPSVTYTIIPEIAGQQFPSVDKVINVVPAGASLMTSATLVTAGTPVTLTWNCVSGSCMLSGTDLDASPAPPSGSRVVTLAGPSRYQITCAGLTTVSSEVEVNVNVAASIQVVFDWFMSPFGPPPIARVIARWTARFASGCTVTNVRTGGVISTSTQGEYYDPEFASYPPDPGRFRYRIVATGHGPDATAESQPHLP